MAFASRSSGHATCIGWSFWDVGAAVDSALPDWPDRLSQIHRCALRVGCNLRTALGSRFGHAGSSFMHNRDVEIAPCREFHPAIWMCFGFDPDSHGVGSARKLRSLQPIAQPSASLPSRSNTSRADLRDGTMQGMKILGSNMPIKSFSTSSTAQRGEPRFVPPSPGSSRRRSATELHSPRRLARSARPVCWPSPEIFSGGNSRLRVR